MSEIAIQYTDRIKDLHLDLAKLEHGLKSDQDLPDDVAEKIIVLVTDAANRMRKAYYLVR